MYIVHLKTDLSMAKTEINDDGSGPQNRLQLGLVATRYILDRAGFRPVDLKEKSKRRLKKI